MEKLKLTESTKLSDILAAYPWLREELPKMDERFKLMNSPLGKIMLKKATVGDAGKKSGYSVEALTKKLERLIAAHEG